MTITQAQLSYRGAKLYTGEFAKERRYAIDHMVKYIQTCGFEEVDIPILQLKSTYDTRIGGENKNLMFKFKDTINNELALPIEYSCIMSDLSKTLFRERKDAKVFHVGKCFRNEGIGYGRFKEFTAFGVDILNPSKNYESDLYALARGLIFRSQYPLSVRKCDELENLIDIRLNATRKFGYYKNYTTKLPTVLGFEMHCKALGTGSQLVGGGFYDGGFGMAIGIERLVLLKKLINEGLLNV